MTVPPGDDPEQRISNLETSLSGGAVETGARPRHGLRAGWVVLGLLAIALVLGGGAILSARTTRTVTGAPVAGSEISPTTRPARPGAPPTPVPPVAPIPVPTVPPIPIPIPAPVPTAAPPGGDISVAGVGSQRTIACTDSVVSISGVNNTVVITGRCRRVDVSGLENVVTVDESDAIVVSGLNNRITYRSGDPRLDESGIGNTVARG